MDFTSGGTPGPQLDEQAVAALEVEVGNHVCGSLTSVTDAHLAAEVFYAGGWSVRRSGWDEFEVEHTFAQLEILPLSPVVFSGFVDSARIEDLLAALDSLGLPWTVEHENQDGTEQIFRSRHD
ncbi:hypothetical protein AB0M28_13325 [Streptomyces sp. NPDC051940]|uniref:hypothetical protein n=1 Tax=Streptomyces sp. NPDC051940 TaxID=3155675 RepID=UPI003432F9E4